ncbi:MAG: hypothetical protein JMN27_15070 [gamma proteobacterium endosymbiont of Lamellibrachia anaximandri]|nr:hypothetical protein [gamma proteobacterium endosymbiont of Lamellibrachia anaximandri]MBL3535132.1 hypothetical protein [gamma proteobacterium endosymbiont of Lamellibrachia anaximandri]
MDRAVITEQLLELVAEREVQAALFTTYTFEPDFFELEVIPLLLSQEMAYSADDRVKRFMVRENLREADLPIDVFYDLPMFRLSGDCSPEMEYLCNGVNLGNRAFHGKVNMILLKEKATEEETLLLGAGSNNLSHAGWWGNIECQHWEEISSGAVPRRLLNILQEEINFLNGYRSFDSGEKKSAIDHIEAFIYNCRGSYNADPVYYYGLSYPENHRSFINFLHRKPSPLRQYGNWSLEIISPFFADDAKNEEHKVFFNMGIDEIKLLLPFDSENNALCQDSYYEHIQAEEGIQWARWRDDVARSLGLNGEQFRCLHAKMYHFYNKRQSWVFVGSVNFTHKALYENVEAGFLAKLDKAGPLLEPIPDKVLIERFAEPDETVPGEIGEDELNAALPEFHLSYDWVSKRLTGRTARYHAYEIEILGSEGEPVISPWELRYQECEYEGDMQSLEKLLRNGSLVKVRGRNLKLKEKTEFPAHPVLLQQTGWSHKPLDLPELTASQILAIYAGMAPERRKMMLIDAKIRALFLGSQGGELTTYTHEQIIDQFFCEYAEIFSAFSKLRWRLEQAFEAEQYSQVDYYLTGTGVDSLTSLVNRSMDDDGEDGNLNAVTCYLVLLSALEIYRSENFIERQNVKKEAERVCREIESIKKGKRLKLENNGKKNRKHFFRWFEEEFFRTYTTVKGQQ